MKKWILALLLILPFATQANERRSLEELDALVTDKVSARALNTLVLCNMQVKSEASKMVFLKEILDTLTFAKLNEDEFYDYLYLKKRLTVKAASMISASMNISAREAIDKLARKNDCEKLEVRLALK